MKEAFDAKEAKELAAQDTLLFVVLQDT